MIRNILQRIKEKQGEAFTLVELMVTMVLVGILLGASAAGIFYYQKWSVWQRQEHYARTLFLAAQSGMTQYSTDKHGIFLALMIMVKLLNYPQTLWLMN